MKINFNKNVFRSLALISQLSIGWQSYAQTIQVVHTIDPSNIQKDISPNIFGVNNGLDNKTHVPENVGSRRLGANRATSFNWETNASNAGSDYIHSSDGHFSNSFGLTGAAANEEGKVQSVFHQTSIDINQSSTLTVQMAGYVANDKNGAVNTTAPSNRWAQVFPTKGAAFSLTPDKNDSKVYMDEMVNFMVTKFGLSSTSKGVKNWSLDNEPDLWKDTHPFIHPIKPTCVELLNKTIDYSKSVKSIDPDGIVFAGVFSGWGGFADFQGATDWGTVKGNYGFYGAYLLDQMKKESDRVGKRLIDVLDIHFYSEAQAPNGNTRMWFADNSRESAITRMQCTRSFWDSSYKEKSWITQYMVPNAPYICLFPRMQKMIDTYNPGTKIAVTEYNFGGNTHISGGIAQADFFGICAKYGIYQTNIWSGMDGGSIDNYNSAAFKIFRNYDGANSTFGNKYVYSKTNNVTDAPVYAAIDEKDNSLHIILINRNYDNPVASTITLASGSYQTTGKTYYFDKNSATVKQGTDFALSQNGKTLAYQIPAQTVMHFVLKPSTITGIDSEESVEKINSSIYPNPFSDRFNLPSKGEYAIFNITGTLVEKGICEGNCVLGDNYESGVYVLEINDGLKTKKMKVVKK